MNNSTVLGRVHSFTLKDLKTKVGENESRRISGYANAATLDRGNEIVDPQAFKSSLDKFMENPVVFYNHDWDTPIGKVVAATITAAGLLVDIEIGKGFTAADTVWAQIEQGILKAFSIGFRPLMIEFDNDSEILTIKDMELYEVSVVTIPMNRESLFEITENRVTGVKFIDNGNFVSYKSLIQKKAPKKEALVESTKTVGNVSETISVKIELDADEFQNKIKELQAQLKELDLDVVTGAYIEDAECLRDEVMDLNRKLDSAERVITELEHELAGEKAINGMHNTIVVGIAEAWEDELLKEKAKNLIQQMNIPDLIKSVI